MLEVPAPSQERLELRFTTTYKWGNAEARLTLQLALRAGKELETAAGLKETLRQTEIDWAETQTGAWVRHNGWTLHTASGGPVDVAGLPVQPVPERARDRVRVGDWNRLLYHSTRSRRRLRLFWRSKE